MRTKVVRKTLDAVIGVGTFVAGRYRVDLVLSEGASSSLLATRFPDGEKVLLKPIRHTITARKGPLLVHLFKDAKIAQMVPTGLLPIHDFVIDEGTHEAVLVIGYDRTRTAAQIVNPQGREEQTANAFLQIAAALIDQHEHNKVAATPEAARGPIPGPPAPEEWVHVRAEVVSSPDRADPRTVAKRRRNDMYMMIMLLGAVGVIGIVAFGQDRIIKEPELPGWYHDYGEGDADWTDYGDHGNRFANDPDVRAVAAQWITVRTSPPGGGVTVGATYIGRAPVSIPRPERGREKELRVGKPGYGETTVTVDSESPREMTVTLGGMSVKDELTSFIDQLKSGQNPDNPEAEPELDIKGRRVPEPEKKKPSLYDDDP